MGDLMSFAGLALRLTLAKLRQPHGVEVILRDGPRLFLRPRAEFDNDPRQNFIIDGNGNRYSHIFRRATGRLLPLDAAQRYAVETLAPRWSERHGPSIARALLSLVMAPRTVALNPKFEGRNLAKRSFDGPDGTSARISAEEAESALDAYADVERLYRGLFDRLSKAGALSRVRRRGSFTVGATPARAVLDKIDPKLAGHPLGAALLGVIDEASSITPRTRLDAAALSALGIPMPYVHVDSLGGIRLLDHHRIHGARDAGLTIEVIPTTHILSFN